VSESFGTAGVCGPLFCTHPITHQQPKTSKKTEDNFVFYRFYFRYLRFKRPKLRQPPIGPENAHKILRKHVLNIGGQDHSSAYQLVTQLCPFGKTKSELREGGATRP
jgi:hypothetical protein